MQKEKVTKIKGEPLTRIRLNQTKVQDVVTLYCDNSLILFVAEGRIISNGKIFRDK